MQDYRERKTLEIELDSMAGTEVVRLTYLFGIAPVEEDYTTFNVHVPPVPYVDQPVYQGVYDQDGKRLEKTELQEQAYHALAIAHFRSNEDQLAANCYAEYCDPLNEGYRNLMRALHGPELEKQANEFNRLMAIHHAPACAGV